MERGGINTVIGSAVIDHPLLKKDLNDLDTTLLRKDWPVMLRKEWSTGKTKAIQAVRDSLDIQGPELTSTPKSKTEEHRQEIANNMESVEKLTNKICSLQTEKEDDEDQDDHLNLMLNFTTDLAIHMPSILEGDYDERLATVTRLSKSTAELLSKKVTKTSISQAS